MNRPKQAGTRWETELTNRIRDRGIPAARLPEQGNNDHGDVWAINPPDDADGVKVAVAWKRLTGTGNRRTPDGQRDVVVIDTNTFLDLLEHYAMYEPEWGFVIECKARQKLNVTRELGNAVEKALNARKP